MVILCFYLVVLFFFFKGGVILEGVLGCCGLVSGYYSFCFDQVSVVFLIMLFFCGLMSLGFCCHYMGGYSGGYYLYWGMVGFLFVMCCLSSSYSYVFGLIMWEYLGLVSFLLILYYSNSSSLRATLVTLFASRFGDVAFFVIILWNAFWFFDLSIVFLCPFVCLVVLSKSAAFPFISWLLEAMRAPTPVSSLVHSSTLVAAGVWFLFRYGGGWCDNVYIFNVLFFSCLVSLFISSFCSLVFLDLKKIVALSTCNNISWCIIFFLLGDVYLGLVQLLSHGVCKCFLFIILGDLMSCSGGCQDSRGMFSLRYSGVFGLCLQALLVLCLCGVPFLGVFFSKHLFLGGLFSVFNPGLLFVLFLCFFLSYVYSFRLLLLLWGVGGFNVFGFSSSFLAVFFCTIFGSICNYLFCFDIEELNSLGFFGSLFFVFLQVFGSMLGVFIYMSIPFKGFSVWGSVVWGCEWLVSFFYRFFNCFFSFCYFVSYRWELDFGGFVYKSFLFSYSGFWWMSLKVLVLGSFGVFLVLWYFFCCLGVLAFSVFVPKGFIYSDNVVFYYIIIICFIIPSFQVGDLVLNIVSESSYVFFNVFLYTSFSVFCFLLFSFVYCSSALSVFSVSEFVGKCLWCV